MNCDRAGGARARLTPRNPRRPRRPWKAVSGNYGGRAFTFPEDPVTLKHVTPAQFTVVTHQRDGTVSRVTGGNYTLTDDRCEEMPTYGLGSDFDSLKGKAQAFTLRIEGNTWRQSGTLSTGLHIEEVWGRVERQ